MEQLELMEALGEDQEQDVIQMQEELEIHHLLVLHKEIQGEHIILLHIAVKVLQVVEE